MKRRIGSSDDPRSRHGNYYVVAAYGILAAPSQNHTSAAFNFVSICQLFASVSHKMH